MSSGVFEDKPVVKKDVATGSGKVQPDKVVEKKAPSKKSTIKKSVKSDEIK